MHKVIKKFVICVVLTLFVLSFLFVFTGCQSTDKTESYFNSAGIENATIDYNSALNQTKVSFAVSFRNDTIYDIDKVSIKFSFYKGNEYVGQETYSYSKVIKHGKEYTGVFSFTVNEEIDSVRYETWNATHRSFWETYKIWFIVLICLIGVAALIYIAVMIAEDLELFDTIEAIADFFEEHGWVMVSLIIPVGFAIWGAVTSWVPVLLVLGGVLSFVVIALLAHLIKYIIEEIGFGGVGFGNDSSYDGLKDKVEASIANGEDIGGYTVDELKEYCREKGISGYSSLRKNELISLIMGKNMEIDDSKSQETKVSPPKKNSHDITFDDIAGMEDAKRAFKEKVVYALANRELYEKFGKKVGGGILLYGLPGTGKTAFAEAASNETDSLFIPIKCADIKSKWYGESEENIKKIFDKARKAGKAIIFFDEFEAIGAKRTDNSDNGNNDLVPQILAEMQGVDTKGESIVVVIAATNKPWAIDSAFLRPGRFDEKIYIPLPDAEARKKLFEINLNGVPQENLDYDYLATITEGFNGADVVGFCDKLKMCAINKSMADGKEHPITMEDVKKIETIIKSSVSAEDIERLQMFQQ